MKAYVVESAGGPFRKMNMERPNPSSSQVLVKVVASGLNPLDTKIRAGQAQHARQPLPAVLGLDMAGIVESVGSDVTGFRPGDEVFGMVGGVGGIQGTLAEFVAADADLLAHRPKLLSMQQAAVMPLVTITTRVQIREMQEQGNRKQHADEPGALCASSCLAGVGLRAFRRGRDSLCSRLRLPRRSSLGPAHSGLLRVVTALADPGSPEKRVRTRQRRHVQKLKHSLP